MRLRALSPSLPANVLSALESCNIRTDTDLIFSGSPISIIARLPPGTISLKELGDLIERLTEKAAAPGIRGDQALGRDKGQEILHRHAFSGIPALDRLLGDFSRPEVIEISGDRSSGKTALALRVLLYHLSSIYDSEAVWIDTTGDFSAERIPPMLASYVGQGQSSTVLERLQVASAFDIEAVHDVLESLHTLISPSSYPEPTSRFVVIDSITPLLAPLLSVVTSQGHAIMTSFMRELGTLAESLRLTIIVINSSSASAPYNPNSAFASTTRKPALGPSFTYLTDVTIWLAKRDANPEDPEDEASLHTAEVLRSRISVSRVCTFLTRYGLNAKLISLAFEDVVYFQDPKWRLQRMTISCQRCSA